MTPANRNARSLLLATAFVYLAVIAGLIVQIRHVAGGHFVYALDDPYIHLALASQIAHGHYGINATEPSSPSSSLLWPFLLVPFASRTWHVYLPLFWNILFGLLASALLAFTVDRWPSHPDAQGRMSWRKKFLVTLLLMAVANLFSLTIVGMEHVLQILLAIACAIGFLKALDGDAIPLWCCAAAAMAPWVRYEDLTLTLAVCLALAVRKQLARAASVAALGVLPLLAFGFFLKSRGLTALPTSVLVKGGVYSQPGGFFDQAFAILRVDLYLLFHDPNRTYTAILAVGFLLVLRAQRDRTRRLVVAAAASVPILQLLIGPFGWFHRYEVYGVIFSVLILIRLLAGQPLFRFPYMVMGLICVAIPYINAVAHTAAASAETYHQQYQMHRFEDDFYRGNIAVNDLGLVSYGRPPNAYVLDLVGLASPEAAAQTVKTAPWLDAITRRHHVGLAILYPDWFTTPATWTPLARMCRPGPDVQIMGQRCVVFYSTSIGPRQQLHDELQRFAPTLPPGVEFTLDPGR
jgi:hypothetical protein